MIAALWWWNERTQHSAFIRPGQCVSRCAIAFHTCTSARLHHAGGSCRAQAKPERKQEGTTSDNAALIGAAGLLAPFLVDVDPAFAGNPLLTGKTVSLIHPAMMLFLFSASAYTAWLGFQWR